MVNCSILDCTLRDGGYINKFDFGYNVIKDIINKLKESNVDIIECGFLKSGCFNRDKTVFGSVESIKEFISPKRQDVMYVAMIAYGEISVDEISYCDGTSIDGIRLTFHKHQIEEAFLAGKQLMEKNYKVFMQPVGTTSYDDKELAELTERINILHPYAFYLVDTLGKMFAEDIVGMFHQVDKILDKDIKLGFHSHNNLQLSFANAIALLALKSDRELIVDSSVFGMGRGAGNLCTELVMKHVNRTCGNRYDVVPILEIYDEHINKILLTYKWGYSLPYFLASSNNCHPNYATHLVNKQTLSIKEINFILFSIKPEKRELFDKEYIEKLYIDFQKSTVDDTQTICALKELLENRDVVVIAPGKSILSDGEKIKRHCNDNDSLVISVNFVPEHIGVDCLFVSNHKRYKTLCETGLIKKPETVIVTSNIHAVEAKMPFTINYTDYLVDSDIVSDNAGLMLIKLLIKLKVKRVNLVGFDGFSVNRIDNYYHSEYTNSTEFSELGEKTNAIAGELKKLSGNIEIKYLTKSRYDNEQI